jgi:uncharacterized OsmC-like protein
MCDCPVTVTTLKQCPRRANLNTRTRTKITEEHELSEPIFTKLKQIQGYKFKAEFDAEGIPDLIIDELKPLGENSGPNPTRLLFVAVGHCLSSSLLFCLSKARINVKNLETTIKATQEKNEEGHLRISQLEVEMHLEVDEQDRKRVARCLDIFEDYCTVTQSVRKGIEVNVNIKQTNK